MPHNDSSPAVHPIMQDALRGIAPAPVIGEVGELIARLHDRLVICRDLNDDAQIDCQVMRDAKAALSAQAGEISHLRDCFTAARDVIAELKRDLSTARAELAEWQSRHADLSELLDKARDEASAARVEIETLTEDRDTRMQAQSELHDILDDAHIAGGSGLGRVRHLISELSSARAEIARRRIPPGAAMRERLEKAEGERDSMREDAEETIIANRRLKDERNEHEMDASRERTLRLAAESSLSKAVEEEREAIAARLEKRARMYQLNDGEPGPLSSEWGWRDIAKTYRDEAAAIRANTPQLPNPRVDFDDTSHKAARLTDAEEAQETVKAARVDDEPQYPDDAEVERQIDTIAARVKSLDEPGSGQGESGVIGRRVRISFGAPVMQDHGFWTWPLDGADPAQVFTVAPKDEPFGEGRTTKLIAPGYGVLDKPDAYGSGAVYAREGDLIDASPSHPITPSPRERVIEAAKALYAAKIGDHWFEKWTELRRAIDALLSTEKEADHG